jgi:hypothetical protein
MYYFAVSYCNLHAAESFCRKVFRSSAGQVISTVLTESGDISIISQMHQFHVLHAYFFTIYLILSCHLLQRGRYIYVYFNL